MLVLVWNILKGVHFYIPVVVVGKDRHVNELLSVLGIVDKEDEIVLVHLSNNRVRNSANTLWKSIQVEDDVFIAKNVSLLIDLQDNLLLIVLFQVLVLVESYQHWVPFELIQSCLRIKVNCFMKSVFSFCDEKGIFWFWIFLKYSCILTVCTF